MSDGKGRIDCEEWAVEGIRLHPCVKSAPLAPCSRCEVVGCPWDRVGHSSICPDCQEMLMMGSAPPLSQPLQAGFCLICQEVGTLSYTTFPLQREVCLEIDLCPEHLQALLARRLTCDALERLGQHLEPLGLHMREIFLLHEAFYDDEGQPIQPVPDCP